MKPVHILLLLLCLSACGYRTRHDNRDPVPFVESQISLHIKKIALAQERLNQASGIADFAHKNKLKSVMNTNKKKGLTPKGDFLNKTGKPPVQKRASMTKKTLQTEKIWHAKKGSTLKESLYLWVEQEKCPHEKKRTWSLIWDTDTNYRMDAPLSFSGTFLDALNGIFRLYAKATVPLFAGINTTQCLLKVNDKERES